MHTLARLARLVTTRPGARTHALLDAFAAEDARVPCNRVRKTLRAIAERTTAPGGALGGATQWTLRPPFRYLCDLPPEAPVAVTAAIADAAYARAARRVASAAGDVAILLDVRALARLAHVLESHPDASTGALADAYAAEDASVSRDDVAAAIRAVAYAAPATHRWALRKSFRFLRRLPAAGSC